jgi:hypothetical protein
MASFTQFVNTQRAAYHGVAAVDATADETRLDEMYGKQEWSARLLGPNIWALYVWRPFTIDQQQHGMWQAANRPITRAKTYHEAVAHFANEAK